MRRRRSRLYPAAANAAFAWIEDTIVLPEGLVRRPGADAALPVPAGNCRLHWRPGKRAGDHAKGGSDRLLGFARRGDRQLLHQ